jgi:hypothetical protein
MLKKQQHVPDGSCTTRVNFRCKPTLPEIVADPRYIDEDHEADSVITHAEVYGVVVPIDDAAGCR